MSETSDFTFVCDIEHDTPESPCRRQLMVWANDWPDARRQASACLWHCYVGGQSRCPEHNPERG